MSVSVDSTGPKPVDVANLRLELGGTTEARTAKEGSAFNWHGYHIAVVAIYHSHRFMSGTNWRLPEPIWNDGNDIADWSPAQLAQANARGWAQSTFVQIDNVTGKPRTDPHAVAATVIDVIVK